MRKLILITWSVLFLAQSAWSYEYRVWEYANGEQFTGRFVRDILGKLMIEKEDGTTETVEAEELSELDQKYARTMVPPELEAKGSRKVRQVKPRPQPQYSHPITMNRYQLKVEIEKKSQRPFTSRLKAEIFMIAEENISDDYVLMHKTDAEFLFPLKKKNAAVELETPWVEMRIYEGGYMGAGSRIGQDYAGYLLVVSTLQGEICYTDASPRSLRPLVEDPEVINNLRNLWIEGRPLWLSRLFDQAGRKIPPPRPSPSTTAP